MRTLAPTYLIASQLVHNLKIFFLKIYSLREKISLDQRSRDITAEEMTCGAETPMPTLLHCLIDDIFRIQS
jgi:hypothetical protein